MDYQNKSKEELIVELQNLQQNNNKLSELLENAVNQRKKAELAVHESEAKFRKIYEEGPFGMAMVNREFKFITANITFCRMLGYNEHELQNLTIKDITHSDYINIDLPNIKKLINLEISVYKTEKKYVRKDGLELWGSLTVTSNFNSEGQFLYNLAIIEDISKRKRTDEELAVITERLEMATRSAKIGIWDLDVVSNIVVWDDQMFSLFGYSNRTLHESYEVWQKGVHPDDMNRINEISIRTINSGQEYYVEFRVIWPDKSIHWLRSIGQVYFDINKKPVRMIGIDYDITEQKGAAVALKENRDLLLNLARLVPGVIYQYRLYPDGSSAFPYSSPGMYGIYEVTPEEVKEDASPVFTRLHPDDYNNIVNAIRESAQTLETFYCEYRVILPKQGLRWRWSQAHPVRMDDGGTLWHGIISDITERKEADLLLKEKSEEIEAQNEEYQQLNEELLMINEELKEAKEHAEQSDHLKTAFLQNMSHEIRTPMNAIMGFSELLVNQYNNKPKLEQFSKIINQRCSDLLDIINEVLDVAKIESGQVSVNLEKCSLVSLFSEISLFFKEVQERQGKQHLEFSIQTYYGAPGAVILTDKVKLKQIFINLIGNAFKFTDEGSVIAGCRLDIGNQLLFFVSDTGIGIPSDKQDFIFERFAQLESTPSHIYGGTGLGLSIVKGLIELLDGKIWITSELSKGTTFYFSFPYETVERTNHQPSLTDNREAYNLSNKTILIVEDDKYNAAYLKEVLEDTGINLLHTIYGKEAVNISKTQDIDMVLMDVRLPDIDGYTATSLIKKLKPEIIIIAQTAYAAPEDKKKALKAGCNDYISKPVKQEELLSIINKYFNPD